MAADRADHNVSLVVEDLQRLRRALETESDDRGRERVSALAAGYLLANSALIERAVGAWASTPEKELQQLQVEHREIDDSATDHGFQSIGLHALNRARNVLQNAGTLTGDNLHMLDRLLEAAKYVADTSDLTVEWHPVDRLLKEGDGLVEGLRAQLSSAEPEPRRVLDVGPAEFGIRGAGDAAAEDLEPYVPRDVDGELRAALKSAPIVVVRSGAGTGATRTVYEALRAVHPDAYLLAAGRGGEFDDRSFVVETDVPRSAPAVVWVHDLASHILVGGLSAAIVEWVRAAGGVRWLVGILRDDLADGVPADHPVLLAATVVRIDGPLTQRERVHLDRLYPGNETEGFLGRDPPVRPGAARPRREQVEWVADAPATEDLLNRKPLADALANRLVRVAEEEKPPGSFLVHLDGSWGSGKSSILNLLRTDLEKAGWAVVDFNAWQQARVGLAWWTLLTALRQRIARDLSPWGRAQLRTAELWQRGRRTGAPYVLAVGMLALAIAAIVLAFRPFSAAGAKGAAETVAAVLAAVATLWAGTLVIGRFVLWESPAGARLFEQSNKNPMGDLRDHFGWLVSRFGRPVVFFVDDLDRCEQEYVVEFLDAIQTLVRDSPGQAGGSRFGPYVVVAADGGWIRGSYEEAYARPTSTLVSPGQTLGHLFLDKIFQLTVTVPSLSPTRQTTYLQELLRADGAEAVAMQAERAEVEERIRQSTTHAEVREAWGGASEAVREAVAPVAVQKLTDDEVEAATEHELEKFSRLLDRNPRRMKRFLNVYTVELVSSGLEGNFVDPDSLALWTIIGLRWPTLAEHLRMRPESIEWMNGGVVPDDVEAGVKAAFALPEVREVAGFEPGGPLTKELVEQLAGRTAAAAV